MAFYHRAKSMYDRGEVVRAATILAEGLKREPGDVESLEWLLHLYVKEIPNPGLEVEMVKILAAQANGRDLLEIVQSELEAANMSDKIKALDNVRRREGVLMDPPAARPAPVAAPAATIPAVTSTRPAAAQDDDEPEQTEESWQSFSDPTDEIAQVQSRTPAPRTAPIPAPVAGADTDAPRSTPRNTRPLPPLDDPADELDDSDDDVSRSDAQRPVMTWVIVGVAGTLLLFALVMALMRGSAATEEAPEASPSEMEGSGGAMRMPSRTSWSIA